MIMSALRYLPQVATSWRRETDVVVVGAGAAGLSAALDASRLGLRVILVSKLSLLGGSTLYAQGGLAAVMSDDDSIESHVTDTIIAAAGLADETVVRELVGEAPRAVHYLGELGANFDQGPLGLEGGHSHRRIVHAGGDAIGAELHRVLREAVLNSDVEILENTVAIDALTNESGTVVGLVAGTVPSEKDLPLTNGVIMARAVVLATGGFGQAFTSSTNPVEVTGDGLALAVRAGAEVTNVEFMQFHPTVLYIASHRGQSSLITEAIRGAGARIVDATGSPVMRGRHVREDLAPRDIVSYEMFQRMHSPFDPTDHLWLDARDIGEDRLEREFPTTVALCRDAGVDPVSQLIPIAPGAHYSCGGIRANLDGVTSVPGLYAIGEAAATGVHGANRLASNSLTEAIISGRRVARLINTELNSRSHLAEVMGGDVLIHGRGVRANSREQLATVMTAHAGVVRDRTGLEIVLKTLDATPDGPEQPLDLATLEATNLHAVSQFVAHAALLREESRGSHRRSDFERASDDWLRSITLRVHEGQIETRTDVMVGA